MPDAAVDSLEAFLTRWEASGGAERANFPAFLHELCDVLDVARPDPTRPDDSDNGYVFERAVTFQNPNGSTSAGRIDLYKRGCFVLEAKQGSDKAESSGLSTSPRRLRRGTAVRGTAGWDEAMLAARGQADQYVRALPSSEPNPPFILVVDVGHTIEVYSDFSRQGRTYVPFPDPLTHRIRFRDLARPEIRERLRLVWTDPLDLDPSRRSAKVTKEVADRLAKLAKSLEASGHAPEVTAQFLMRCLFTFFAEDVGLLPTDGFTNILRDLHDRREVHLFPEMTGSLWEAMKTGTKFFPMFRQKILHFNGGLFESADALPLTADQLALMVDAGEMQWRDVEPAIFGTLLERALNPVERHKLGAHHTPRAYVERLVMPTIIDPLREQWSNVLAAAVTRVNEAEDEYATAAASRDVRTDRVATAKRDAALKEARGLVHDFLKELCSLKILDPACGTANFLYVTMEHMKRLEGEVWDVLKQLGETQSFEGFGMTVDPHQFLGIEINPRAAAIADLVLWIGYLQWHFRTYGDKLPAEPIIRAYNNIERRDALLAYDDTEPLRDERGTPVTRWDGRTMKTHPVTGEQVPDDTARVFVLKYLNPRKAEWPEADYIVGNPPFLGQQRLRTGLGDGYVDVLQTWHSDVPNTSDLVMYWWNKAAECTKRSTVQRFGFVTTNTITQPLNRKIVECYLEGNEPLSLVFAIPDHPWADDRDSADVRIAMSVAEKGQRLGVLLAVSEEQPSEYGMPIVVLKMSSGRINPDLSIGVDLSPCTELRANEGLAIKGFELGSQGFLLNRDIGSSWIEVRPSITKVLRPYMNGEDLKNGKWHRYVIDFFGLSESESSAHALAYQHVYDQVVPDRATNREQRSKRDWWLFRRSGIKLREAQSGLSRFIGTTRTAKFRVFQFLPSDMAAESKIVVIATDSACVLGTLSSRIHVTFATKIGGWLGVGNDPTYNHTDCFNKFAFPVLSIDAANAIAVAAERLDRHRKDRLAEHSSLTITDLYNVLEKVLSRSNLSDDERVIYKQGLVSVLKQIHDDLDAAVFDAYGWPRDLTDDEILVRLVALNRERAEEEKRGLIRWLRPEYQNPNGPKPTPARQESLLEDEPEAPTSPAKPTKKQPWPKSLPEQAQAVRALLTASPQALTPAALAKTFQRGQPARVTELLETLVSLGHARAVGDGTFVRS